MATVELICSFCGASKKVSESVARRYAGSTQLRCQACRDAKFTEEYIPICVYNDCGVPLKGIWIEHGTCEPCYRKEVAQEISKRLGYAKEKP